LAEAPFLRNLGPLMSANVLIVQPEVGLAQRIGQLILAGTPDAAVGFVQTPQDGVAALAGYEDLALCVCELYFPEADGVAFLSAVRTRFRHARVIIVSNYNLQNFAAYTQGLTIFPLPLDEAVFSVTCQDALITLEGAEFPPYRLGKKQPPDRWGDCYAAYDTGVKRDVFITVVRNGATAGEAERFRNFAAAMARAGHPNIQAVYQAGNFRGRDFFSREKWEAPSLPEMAVAGQGIDGRMAARIVHMVGSVMIFWDANGHPHTPVAATDVSVSPEGIIKIANCVDPTRAATPPGAADLTALAAGLQTLLSGTPDLPARVQALLERLGSGPVPLAEVVGEAQAIDVELAPEREIAVTEEHVVARRAVAVERRKQKRNINVMAGVAIAVLLVLGYFVYERFLAQPPAREFSDMAKVPAGPYTYQDGAATLDHTFYIDKYEVTFGQYLKFLKAVSAAGTDAAWRSPDQKGEKNHEPAKWLDIFQTIKFHQPYSGEFITLDFPVFNIDWYDAQAYAKWAGKRLPDEHEWEKAARGPNGFLFPWGPTFQPLANTSVFTADALQGSLSKGHHRMVDENPGDRSPYGVMDMAGNVSEWTGTITDSSSLAGEKVAVIRGANFLSHDLDHEELTNRITNYSMTTRQVWLGFRCASDTPPTATK
jgi:formylglycine-generating enzyme required for sulfatase activity/CheY-like chemotaxis protein